MGAELGLGPGGSSKLPAPRGAQKQLRGKRILNGMLCTPFLAISNNPANGEAGTV